MMREPYKGNILQGAQYPGKRQTLRYIDAKEPPHYPMPAIPLEAVWRGRQLTKYETLCVIWNKVTHHAYVAWWFVPPNDCKRA